MISITHRPLGIAEAKTLHDELKTTANILGYTVRELRLFRDVLVADVGGELAGACICKDLLFGWTEIAVVYVLPAFRGTGVGSMLFGDALQQAIHRGRNVAVLSRSPEILHLMARFGMDLPVPMRRAPLAFHLQMCLHMASWWRLREALRKGPEMRDAGRLALGVLRNSR